MDHLFITGEPSQAERLQEAARGLACLLGAARRRASHLQPRGVHLDAKALKAHASSGIHKAVPGQGLAYRSAALEGREALLPLSIRIHVGASVAAMPPKARLPVRQLGQVRPGLAALNCRQIDTSQLPADYKELMGHTWGAAAGTWLSTQKAVSDACAAAGPAAFCEAMPGIGQEQASLLPVGSGLLATVKGAEGPNAGSGLMGMLLGAVMEAPAMEVATTNTSWAQQVPVGNELPQPIAAPADDMEWI